MKSHVERVDFTIHSENVMIEIPLNSDEASENFNYKIYLGFAI